ncbi:MAG: Ldh family oxidoreductase [Blautia marasmi]
MGVTVKIEEIKELMRKALALRGIAGEYAEFMISDYLESELEGHRTHGLSKFLTVDAGLSRRSGDMKLIKQKGCYAQVDGNGELGHIAALYSTNLAIAAAKEHGVGITALKNVGRYSRITPYARKISKEGLVGMITNNGGPACVAPFGGAKAMFGTNPSVSPSPAKEENLIFLILPLPRRYGAKSGSPLWRTGRFRITVL